MEIFLTLGLCAVGTVFGFALVYWGLVSVGEDLKEQARQEAINECLQNENAALRAQQATQPVWPQPHQPFIVIAPQDAPEKQPVIIVPRNGKGGPPPLPYQN